VGTAGVPPADGGILPQSKAQVPGTPVHFTAYALHDLGPTGEK